MQAAKNLAATVKQKMGNAAAHVEEKKEDTKFAAEEKKVDSRRAHGDESAKDEKNEREVGAEQHREAQYAEDKERAVNPHPGSIGDKPTPADLDRAMGADNPANPVNSEYSSDSNAMAKSDAWGQSSTVIPTYIL